jgi:hypothetical protein
MVDIFTSTVIFHKGELGINSNGNDNFESGRDGCTVGSSDFGGVVERDDRSSTGQDGDRVGSSVHDNDSITIIGSSGKEVDIPAMRQPAFNRTHVGAEYLLLGDRSNNHFGPKQEFVPVSIGVVLGRMIVVHGLDERSALQSSSYRHGVQVWDHSVSELKDLGHDLVTFRTSEPGFSDNRLIPVAVQSKNGREKAELDPSDHELVVLVVNLAPQATSTAYSDSVMMSTDIMGPPSVTNISRGSSELGLEGESTPKNLGVLVISIAMKLMKATYTGETNRVSLISRTSKPRKCHPSLESPLGVHKVIMIQHPHGINSLSSSKVSLLPINPPKVNTFIFKGMMNFGKVRFKELSIGRIKQNSLSSVDDTRVDVHRQRKDLGPISCTFARSFLRMIEYRLRGEC